MRSNILFLIGAIFPSLVVPPHQAHRMYPLSQYLQNMTLETGYFHIQATKPDTLGKLQLSLKAYYTTRYTGSVDQGVRGP